MNHPNTNSIVSPEADSNSRGGSCSSPSSSAANEIPTPQFELLTNLEALLLASQRALLSRDVSLLSKLTAQQAQLHRAFADLAGRARGHPADAVPPPDATASAVHASVLEALRAAGCRVLHLGRVQQLLLARAQASLQVISNCLAGPHASYEPMPGSAGLGLRPTAPLHCPRSEEA